MIRDLNIINPVTYNGWDSLLISTPGHTFFHSSPWAQVLCETYDYRPFYFTLFDKDRFLALIPMLEINSILTGRRAVSLPFADSCEPLIDECVSCNEIVSRIIEYGKLYGWKFIELRGGAAVLKDAENFTCYYGHTLDLSPDEEYLLRKLRDSTKRNIKKAISQNVKTEILDSFDSVKKYFHLHCLTRKRHGRPPQPFTFFKKIYEHVISKNLGIVVLAFLDEKPIAGSVYFHFGKKAIYKYGASDSAYQNVRANNLVMWEAIKWFSSNGYESLCFGRTEPENVGLRQFKTGWGVTEHIIKYYKYDLSRSMFTAEGQKVSGFYNTILRKMPQPLLNMLGTILYRHVG